MGNVIIVVIEKYGIYYHNNLGDLKISSPHCLTFNLTETGILPVNMPTKIFNYLWKLKQLSSS